MRINNDAIIDSQTYEETKLECKMLDKEYFGLWTIYIFTRQHLNRRQMLYRDDLITEIVFWQ